VAATSVIVDPFFAHDEVGRFPELTWTENKCYQDGLDGDFRSFSTEIDLDSQGVLIRNLYEVEFKFSKVKCTAVYGDVAEVDEVYDSSLQVQQRRQLAL
jgi:hypothetical protein